MTRDATDVRACPFCAGRVQANDRGVRHSLPTCHQFDALEADEFVLHLRSHMRAEREKLRRGRLN